MKKRFEYFVGTTVFTGYEPWGEAWRQAKALATETHQAIYRLITILEGYNEGNTSYEVCLTGGVFLNAQLAKEEDVKIW